ncbi:MAG: hypothetical protein OEW04_00520 [Nitrospirota bacterium]|nr:hypothetical protein [Nitrospirota bacterium]
MRKLLLFTYVALGSFFILTPPAHSSEWLQVESSIAGERNYIDLDSIRYDKTTVTFWTRNIDKKGEMIKMSFSMNCENGTGAIRDIIIYGSNETVVKSYSFKDEKLQWGRITAHSFMYGFHKLLCKEKFTK